MLDPLSSLCVREPSYNMVSDPSSNSEDLNSSRSCNEECNCEEQYQPKKNKKRPKKISRIIKYVVGFSYVKKLKITKKTHKKRRDNNKNDKTSSPRVTTFQRLNSEPSKSSLTNDHVSTSMSSFTSFKDDEFEPNVEKSTIATPSTWMSFGLVGMHQIMLMIILAALLLSGKACAIFATIVWLILWPLTSRFDHVRGLQLRRNCKGKELMVRKFMTRF